MNQLFPTDKLEQQVSNLDLALIEIICIGLVPEDVEDAKQWLIDHELELRHRQGPDHIVEVWLDEQIQGTVYVTGKNQSVRFDWRPV